MRTLDEMGCLAAVVEESDAVRDQIRVEYPEVALFESLEEILGKESCGDIAAFVVATPAHTHRAIAKQLFEAGKHVLVEKPMALNVSDAQAIVQAADSSGKILMVGHLLLFQPAVRFLKQYLSEGKLGELYTLTQRRLKLGRARKVENVLWSFGVHDIAVLLYLVGEAPAESKASGHVGISANIQDDVHLHMRFESGIVANLHNSWLWPRVERELIVTGEKGILVYDEINQRVILHRKGIDNELQNVDGGETVIFEEEAQPLRLELEHFLSCCESGETPVSDGMNGLDVVKVLESSETR